ncbi:Acid phosphatase (Class B) [Macleaya cordata]|uniref:Acid phosphatase (Class B) n=1 Tax=Macleaya cordata TaxID=56857 RepID=A0A200QPR8_MACCD|nr:Acid phosphatase (Class B) [Macleaya cordata]
MDSGRFCLVLILSCLISGVVSQSILQILPENRISGDRKTLLRDDDIFCDSWRFSIETNDAGIWYNIPARCVKFVQNYMLGERYASDSDQVAEDSLTFANTIEITGDGKDAWIFDIDETLLSNLPYYEIHGFGSEVFDEKTFDEWVDLAEAPALPASLKLYNELQRLGFKLILLTGRAEFQRSATEKNLLLAGYGNWEKLILRGASDIGKTAEMYKSEKRKEEEEEGGYRIHGNSGDQWSDLLGFAMATRSFKLPNPMYYIP